MIPHQRIVLAVDENGDVFIEPEGLQVGDIGHLFALMEADAGVEVNASAQAVYDAAAACRGECGEHLDPDKR